MDAFYQDRMFILQQPVQQFSIGPGTDNIGQLVAETLMAFFPGVVSNFSTIVIQFLLPAPSIFETVQMDGYSFLMHGLDLIKKIKNAPVIWREGDIMTNDMQMLFQ
jgi:hypothetical protein